MRVLPDERAPTTVALPDRATHVGGNRALVSNGLRTTRFVCLCHFSLLESGNKEHQRPTEDLGNVARGQRVPEQHLRLSQKVVRLLIHGEFDRESLD